MKIPFLKKRGFSLDVFLTTYNEQLDKIEKASERGEWQEAANLTWSLGMTTKDISQQYAMSPEDRQQLMDLRVLCAKQYKELQTRAVTTDLFDGCPS